MLRVFIGKELGDFFIRLHQDVLDLLVGETSSRVDHCPGEAGGADLAVLVDLHHTALGQAVDLWHERAEVVRELAWDHGKHAVCHVGGVATFACLFIEGAARFDIVGDIGDVHGKFPAAIIVATLAIRSFFDTDGVIKVLGIMRINGDHG